MTVRTRRYILDPVQRFHSGELIDDRYEIMGTLGHGGMAQVYRAYDRHLERDVALKVLRPHLTEMDQERFRREIRTLARLNHPGIVTIFDLGRGEHVYFAMELITGGLFTDLGPLEADIESLLTFLEAAVTVAEALAYVHRYGVVHRDLTPRNILMTSRGQPKVMDFGLVQLAEASRQLTRTGFTLGTPQYMAPEQAQGDPIGAHTDLYALGAVFFKAATGVAPFEAENDQAVLYQHVYGSLPPPHELNPDLPPALCTLIESLLAKNPKARPTSGERVVATLQAIRAEVERGSSHLRGGGAGVRGYLGYGPPNPHTLTRAWGIKLEEGPQWPAALTAAEGFVLLGLRSDELGVLHPADGGVQARFRVEDEVNSAVVYHRRTLAFTSRDGGLHALRWPSGREIWSDLDAAAVGVTPWGGDLLITCGLGGMGGLERRTLTGEQVWRFDTSSPAVTPPTVQRGQATFATREGWLHSVELKSGEERFRLQLGSVVAQPVAFHNLLLLSERNGDLHAFDTENHETLWSYDLEGELWASPVVWDRFVFAVSWAGVVYCLALATGDDLWTCDVGARITASPVLAGNVLYVVTEEGRLEALDAGSGARLFCDTVSMSPIQASPVIVGATLVVAALDGTVQAYR